MSGAASLYERYQDGWGLTDVAWSSFLRGDRSRDGANSIEASKQFEDVRPWLAAVAGHRIAATPDDRADRVCQALEELVRARPRSDLRQHFVFTTLTIDRAPSDKALTTVLALAPARTDPIYKALGTGYHAFRRGDYPAAMSWATSPRSVSINPQSTKTASRLHAALFHCEPGAGRAR